MLLQLEKLVQDHLPMKACNHSQICVGSMAAAMKRKGTHDQCFTGLWRDRLQGDPNPVCMYGRMRQI